MDERAEKLIMGILRGLHVNDKQLEIIDMISKVEELDNLDIVTDGHTKSESTIFPGMGDYSHETLSQIALKGSVLPQYYTAERFKALLEGYGLSPSRIIYNVDPTLAGVYFNAGESMGLVHKEKKNIQHKIYLAISASSK